MSDTAPADITTTDTANNSKQAKRWRDVLPIHPATELFPLMNDAELHELADDIEKNRGGPRPAPDPGSSRCQHCGTAFTPRSGSGGKPQRYCSVECQTASHGKTQRAQRAPTYSAEPMLPAVTQRAEKDAPAATPEDFDWTADSVVLSEQPATAVYFDQEGSLVIRQRSWPDDDSYVVISATCIDTFVDKLCDVVGIPSAGRP